MVRSRGSEAWRWKGPRGKTGRFRARSRLISGPRVRGGKLFVKFRKRSGSERASHRGPLERQAPLGPRDVPRASRSPRRETKRLRSGEAERGQNRTCAALAAPPPAASPLPPTLQQVAAAPRAPVPSLAPGPAPAGGPQYPS